MKLKNLFKKVIVSTLISTMTITAAGEYIPVSIVKTVEAATTEIRENVNTPLKSGHVLVGVQGKDYTSNVTDVLNKINQVRYDACKEGVINPATDKPLTLNDYKPLKIGKLCTNSAKIRAAEASLYLDHTRPNGESCHTVIYALYGREYGLGWTGENLAWYPNYTTSIEGWIDEKDDYVNKVPNAMVGHYEALISTNFNYIGISSFNPDNDTQKWDWTCTEATFAGNDTEVTPENAKNGLSVLAKVEVPLSKTYNQYISGVDTYEIGDINSYEVLVSYDNKQNDNRASKVKDCKVIDKVKWESSDESILRFDGTSFEALKSGNVTITATVGEGNGVLKLTKNIYVKPPHIISQKLQFTEKTIKYNGTYTLPKMEVVWSNGDETVEEVNWDLNKDKIKKINEIISNVDGGSFKITGSYNGKSVTVKYIVAKKGVKVTDKTDSSKSGISSEDNSNKKSSKRKKVFYKKGKILKDKKFIYKVIKVASKNGKVAGKLKIIGLNKKSLKTVKIPAYKKFSGVKYKVTAIGKKALKKLRKIKKVKMPKRLAKKYKKLIKQ